MQDFNVVFYNEDSAGIITDSITVKIGATDETELDVIIEKDYTKLTNIYSWYMLEEKENKKENVIILQQRCFSCNGKLNEGEGNRFMVKTGYVFGSGGDQYQKEILCNECFDKEKIKKDNRIITIIIGIIIVILFFFWCVANDPSNR